MEINKKLIIIFYFVILLILFIGFFSLWFMNIYFKNNQLREKIDILTEEEDFIIIKSLLLIGTDNLNDYNKIKSEIEIRRTEFDLLFNKIHPAIHKLEIEETEIFENNFDEFIRISNILIKLQKEDLIAEKEFVEMTKFERDLRYNIRNISINLDDVVLRNYVLLMEYNSKEALYQYKDDEHLDEWFESIKQLRNNIEKLALQEEKKQQLVEDINSYSIISADLRDIALKQKELEKEKNDRIIDLQTIVDKLEVNEKRMSNIINSQNELLARNIFWIILIITGGGVILLITARIQIIRSVSKTSKAKRTKFGRRRRKYANKK